jgi:hypothetical protein
MLGLVSDHQPKLYKTRSSLFGGGGGPNFSREKEKLEKKGPGVWPFFQG